MMKVIVYILLLIVGLFVPVPGADQANAAVYYSIHNGSYRTEESAREYAASIGTGIPTFVEKVEVPGKGTWYRVYIGKFGDMKKAKKAVVSLKEKNIEALGRIRKFSSTDLKGLTSLEAKPDKVKSPPVVSGKTPLKAKVEELNFPETKTRKGKPSTSKDLASKKVETAKGVPEAVDPVVGRAGRAIEEGHYSEAIDLLNNFTSQGHPDKRSAEAALRKVAEAWYKTGEKGNLQALLQAVDKYKLVIERHPNPAEGNDLAYYHMAKSYEKLNFFYEAAAAWESIVLNYPHSSFAEEAFFRSGYALLPTAKKDKLSERLMRYIKSYPDGSFAGKSYYAIGYVLFQMRNQDQASRWFDSARKKWPDWSDVPVNILDSMANCYLNMARYDEAFQVASYLANIYPHGDFGKNALFMMARAADNGENDDLAVKLYGLFIEKYPQSAEARDCELNLANLGVEKPGLKAGANIFGVESYLNPLQTYNKIIAAGRGGDLERVLLWKGKALEKNGDFRGALNNYLEMLNTYPKGKLRNEVLQNIKRLVALFVEKHFTNGDYPAVAELYFTLRGKIPLTDDFGTGFRIGKSLQKVGIYREARNIYGELRVVEKYGDAEELALAMIEVDVAMKDSVAAEYKLSQLSVKRNKGNIKALQDVMRKLADLFLETGDFEKAANFYAKVIGRGGQRDAVLYLNYGRCLEAKKMTGEARKNLLTALQYCEGDRKNCEDAVLSGIYSILGDTWVGQNEFGKGVEMYRKALEYASDAESKRWLMLKTGKSYGKMDDYRASEKSFVRIKEVPDGDFWPGVADFFISQGARAQDGRGKQ